MRGGKRRRVVLLVWVVWGMHVVSAGEGGKVEVVYGGKEAVFQPRIVVDGRGNVHVIFLRGKGKDLTLMYAWKRGGKWEVEDMGISGFLGRNDVVGLERGAGVFVVKWGDERRVWSYRRMAAGRWEKEEIGKIGSEGRKYGVVGLVASADICTEAVACSYKERGKGKSGWKTVVFYRRKGMGRWEKEEVGRGEEGGAYDCNVCNCEARDGRVVVLYRRSYWRGEKPEVEMRVTMIGEDGRVRDVGVIKDVGRGGIFLDEGGKVRIVVCFSEGMKVRVWSGEVNFEKGVIGWSSKKEMEIGGRNEFSLLSVTAKVVMDEKGKAQVVWRDARGVIRRLVEGWKYEVIDEGREMDVAVGGGNKLHLVYTKAGKVLYRRMGVGR